jgi:hypothetical protein
LDRWFAAPVVHYATVPAVLRQQWCWDTMRDGTRYFVPEANVPNFELGIETDSKGDWRDAKIKAFSAVENTLSLIEGYRSQPRIEIGLEYRVIGWKAMRENTY